MYISGLYMYMFTYIYIPNLTFHSCYCFFGNVGVYDGMHVLITSKQGITLSF